MLAQYEALPTDVDVSGAFNTTIWEAAQDSNLVIMVKSAWARAMDK